MIRVFPRQTKWIPIDPLSFVGDPPLFRPPQMPVRISVVFTWDIPEGLRLQKAWSTFYDDVQIGSPAFDDQGDEFKPGRFIKEGITITSRGCPKKCKWCFVPKREGALRELTIKDGWIIQDNNILACSKKHLEGVFDMLKRQPHAAEFKGGIDATLLQEWHRNLFDSVRVNELWFACDTPSGIKPLERASKILNGIPQRKRYCYTLIGFKKESLADAERRLERVYELGFLPFAQLYQPEIHIDYPKEWKDLARKWSRPAAFKSHMNSRKLTGAPDQAAATTLKKETAGAAL